MKFKIGDSFRVIQNNLMGEIVAIGFNSFFQQQEYIVKWESFAQNESYVVDEVDSIWELVSTSVYIKAPQGIDFIPIDITIGSNIRCNTHDHDYVEVGFIFTKMVCKNCDLEKK